MYLISIVFLEFTVYNDDNKCLLKRGVFEDCFTFLKKPNLSFKKKVSRLNLLNFRYKTAEYYNVLVFIFFLFMTSLHNYWISSEKRTSYLHECIIETSVFLW